MAYLSFMCFIPDEEYDEPDNFEVVSLKGDKMVLRFSYSNKSSRYIYPSAGYYFANDDICEFKEDVSKACSLMIIDNFNSRLLKRIKNKESYFVNEKKKTQSPPKPEKFSRRCRNKKA